MIKTSTISFSLPIELAIVLEEYLETKKITRSEFLKSAITAYLNLNENNNSMDKKINEIYNIVKEIESRLNK